MQQPLQPEHLCGYSVVATLHATTCDNAEAAGFFFSLVTAATSMTVGFWGLA
jgi:hypothetical protein